MLKKNIFIIASKKKSYWVSCRSISINLVKAYKETDSTISFGSYDGFSSDAEIKCLITQITKSKPHQIIFLEHSPHPLKVIEKLHHTYKNKALTVKPQIFIHVYGDFPLYLFNWYQCEPYLKEFKVTFVCASFAQKKLLEAFIVKSDQVKICQFPVDIKIFRPITSNSNFRRLLDIGKHEVVFLYTGRISRQKQSLELIGCFSDLICAKLKSNESSLPYLLLAGTFDDLGVPYLNKHDHLNAFFSEFGIMYQGLKDEVRKRIHYLGNLNHEDLAQIYNEADCFVSPSLHNDEDYGYSPAEALCSGLPVILTAWGGYRSFISYGKNVNIVRTSIGPGGPSFNYQDLYDLLSYFSTRRLKEAEKIKNALFASSKLSNGSVSQILRQLLSSRSSKFSGFKRTDLSFSVDGHRLPIFNENQVVYNSEYVSLYKAYVE